MTLASVVETAKAKIHEVELKGKSYIPQIMEAHQKVVTAERSGHQRSLDCAIAAGELLLAAKDAIKGQFEWTDWRNEYLPGIPQTTASLYMRLARNKDRLLEPDPATDDGKRISNAVATLAANGQLSIRKAAALLATKQLRGTKRKKKSNEEIGKEYLRGLAADGLVTVLKEVRGPEYLGELRKALAPAADATAA